MKSTFCLLLVFLSLYHLQVFAQRKDGMEIFGREKDDLLINEIYLYHEPTDKIKYRRFRKKREWIELYNPTNMRVNLANLYFTDSIEDPFRYAIKRRRSVGWIPKKEFVAIYLNGSGGSRDKFTGYTLKEKNTPIYLVRKQNDGARILDTLSLPIKSKFPFSRYPDGAEFKQTDALTPAKKNSFFKESAPRKMIGVTAHEGISTVRSKSLQGTSRIAFAHSYGIFKVRNKHTYSIEKGLRLGIRGYRIISSTDTEAAKAKRTIETTGRQTTFHLDFSYTLRHHLSNKFSVFYGGVFSIRLGSKLEYDQTTRITYFATGQSVENKSTYFSRGYNAALDLIDLALVVGGKYHLNDRICFAVYYTRDVVGVSGNTIDAPINDSRQTNQGVYLVTEFSLWNSMVRIKREANLYSRLMRKRI